MGRQDKVSLPREQEIYFTNMLKEFKQDQEKTELAFPTSLTKTERAFIHQFCLWKGMKSHSQGSGKNRFITVSNQVEIAPVKKEPTFHMNKVTRTYFLTFSKRFPNEEEPDLIALKKVEVKNVKLTDESIERSYLFGSRGPQIPTLANNTSALAFRQNLPIWSSKLDITQAILDNQVVLISGETGSGKTTQVPQFILEHHGVNQLPCNVICTQPRRIAAVSLSERVAYERGEKVGGTVGYQIRLENRLSSKTLLTFCTSGILLRILMSKRALPSTVTHVIIDELHERNKHTDFLLIILRDLLLHKPNLKLILMSASMNTEMFSKYFNGCPIIEIPGRLFEVKPCFLEDVLKNSMYETSGMKLFKMQHRNEKTQQEKLESCPVVSKINIENITKELKTVKIEEDDSSEDEDIIDVDDELADKVDPILHEAWLSGNDSCFLILLDLIHSEIIPVDWQHREATMSLLMVAAGRGHLETVKTLLDMGANVDLRSFNDWTALDYAKNLGQMDIADFLKGYSSQKGSTSEQEEPEASAASEISDQDKLLVNAYHSTVNEETVDTDLLFHLIKHICFTMGKGAILVFLPGYDDIVTLRDLISHEKNFSLKNQRFSLFALHSKIQNNDQKNVFKPVPAGVRKIVLSTNIAETSITVNDVVFVIDCGKLKERTFDALVGNTQLKTTWISQATAIQRRGRAGRCQEGICYHLFSRARFNILEKYQVPEILRVPIEELCLQVKLLAPPNMPIADFLTRAPDPPAFMVTRNAVALLKTMDALDSSENLTILGVRLLELSIEPRFGKMILCSVMLSCLDPVLTIVCSLSCKDPFLLPSEPSKRKAVFQARYEFSCGASSDHLTLLNAFKSWDIARAEGYADKFCKKYFMSNAAMRMIDGMKKQLLEQLRVSGFLTFAMSDLNINSNVWPVIRAAICTGAYPNLGRVKKKKSCISTKKEDCVRLQRSSVLNGVRGENESSKSAGAKVYKNLPTDWIIYEEMSLTPYTSFLHSCTSTTTFTISLFCGMARPFEIIEDGNQNGGKVTMKIDDWISFSADREVAHSVLRIRQKWQELFFQRMQKPRMPLSNDEVALIDCLTGALVADESLLETHALVTIPRNSILSNWQKPSYSQDSHASSSKFSARNHNKHFMTKGPKYQNEVMQGKSRLPWRQRKAENPQNRSKVMCYQEEFVNRETGTELTLQPGVSKNQRNRSGLVSSGRNETLPGKSQEGTHPQNENEQSFTSSAAAVNSRRKQQLKKKSPSSTVPSTTKYFVIKLCDPEIFKKDLNSNTCAFMPNVEPKLLKAIKEEKQVILFFTRRKTVNFEGVAKFIPIVARQRPLHEKIYSNFYRIEWLQRHEVPFERTRHLKNPLARNHLVKDSTDGQEIEPTVAENLIKLWDAA